jgi:chromosome segregation protein
VRTDKEQAEQRRQEIAELEEQHKAYQEEKFLITRYLNEVEGKRAELDKLILDMQGQKHELELKLAKNQSQVDGYKDRLWDEFEISYMHAMDFKSRDFVMNAAVKEAREIKERMKELGEVNIGAISEYETTNERHQFLTGQRDDIIDAIRNLTSIIDDMDRTIRQKFKESFDRIAEQFAMVFRELFGGGTAELKLENAEDIMEASIDIAAQPPGKRLQNINLMSGGEKTLTAIALMAAVLRVKPTPFVILDEVEAALDEANIVRFARHLQNFRGIQFVLVTHQKMTMEFADVLYGVTMPEQGISKVLSLKLAEDAENL